MVVGPSAYVVSAKSPWNSLKEVQEAARKDPGSFTWARLGGFSTNDFVNLQFLVEAGIDITKTKPVPFQGAGPVLTGAAGGHVLFGSAGIGGVFPLLSSGDIKVLAVTGDQWVAGLPNVPSAKEAGFPKVDITSWFGISGPNGLPDSR